MSKCYCSSNGCRCSKSSVQKTATPKHEEKPLSAAEQRQQEVAALFKAEKEAPAPSVHGYPRKR